MVTHDRSLSKRVSRTLTISDGEIVRDEDMDDVASAHVQHTSGGEGQD